MIQSCHERIKNIIISAGHCSSYLKNFDPSDTEDKINHMGTEWNRLVLQTETIFQSDEIVANQKTEKQLENQNMNGIDCKACHKSFRENTILKHLVKHQLCKAQYAEQEIQKLKDNKTLREKQRYEREKENMIELNS